jgi:spore germination protein
MRALLLACCLLFPAVAAAAEPLRTIGYVAWWMPDSWRTLALEKFDRLLFFDLMFDASGEISERHGWPENWNELRAAALLSQTPLDLTLTCTDPLIYNRLFGSPAAVNILLEQAVALAAQDGVAGLQLDVEIYQGAKPAAIQAYRAFTRALSEQLHTATPGRTLSVFFPMGAEADIYDAPTLAQIDQVILQGYDSHWLEGPHAGPVAPLGGPEAVTWEKALAKGQSLGVPRERMILSFPLYGYEWPVKSAKLRSATAGKGKQAMFGQVAAGAHDEPKISLQERVKKYGATFDPLSASSHYRYKGNDGRYYEGWFEDWWSLLRKVDFLQAEAAGGIALFALGYDDGELVEHLLRRRGVRKPAAPAIN